jgi:ABC-2 type transport system permease protein
MAFMRSCFNGTLYRKNLQRFWPLMLAFLLIWGLPLWVAIASLLERAHNYAFFAGTAEADLQNQLVALANDTLPLLSLGLGTVAAVAVFWYLFSAKSASAYHALPLRRTALFGTAVLSGLTLLAVPTVLALAGVVAIEAAYGVLTAEALRTLGTVAAVMGGAQLLFFAMAVLTAQLAGNAPGMLALTGVENLLAVFLNVIVQELATPYLYGFAGYRISTPAAWLSPIYRMLTVQCDYALDSDVATLVGLQDLWIYGVYAVAAVAVLAVALLLYRKRPVESAGNVLAFPVLRPVFAVGAGICLALLMTDVIRDNFGANRMSLAAVLLLLAFWAFVGWFAGWMAVRKRFRVFTRRTVAGWAVLAVLLCGGLTAAYYDVLGLAARIPDLADIDEAYVAIEGVWETDPATVRALHQLIVDNRDTMAARYEAEDFDNYEYVPLSYTVHGRTVERRYELYLKQADLDTAGTLEAAVLAYFADGDRVANREFGTLDEDAVRYGSLQCNETLTSDADVDQEIGYRSSAADLTADQCLALLDAIRADLAAGHNAYVDDLRLTDYDSDQEWWMTVTCDDEDDIQTYTIGITASMTETREALEALGILDGMRVLQEDYWE